jgi:hypothetical protein
LNSKAKFEGGSSYYSFKRSSRRFQHAFARINLHRPTVGSGILIVTGTEKFVLGEKSTVDQGLTLINFSFNFSTFRGLRWGVSVINVNKNG